MFKNILTAVGIIVICVFGYYFYQHFKQVKRDASGEVQCVNGCDTPEEQARFRKENAGETADGQSERKDSSARQAAADIAKNAATPTEPVNGQTPPIGATPNAAAPAPAAQSVSPQTPLATPSTAPQVSYAAASNPSAPALTTVGLPLTDSQGPNAPNGAHYGANGTYQWYRQGNLTWRVNSNTGQTCIDFATMEEWRKQIVIEHGCGRNA